MSLISSTIARSTATLSGSISAFAVETLELTLADTEYTVAVSAKQFMIQNRSSGLVKIGFITGFSTEYWTLFPGQAFSVENLAGTAINFYFQSPIAAQTLEILSWT